MTPELYKAADEHAALEDLHRRGFTDGLPVVIPTPDRVAELVLASGLDPDLALGDMGPANCIATVENAAVNAVMAGCLPEHFPVVVAAVRAACDPAFDLASIQSTTHPLSPVIVVNGPAREACGRIASGWGALGPGHRANAAIGRALRLMMQNVGGGRPGVTDMAVLGQPGKFTCCFGEAEEASPWPPLAAARGFGAGDSTVTLVGAESPHAVIASPGGDDPDAPERIARVLAAAIANAGSNCTYSGHGTTLVAVNPNHARILARRFTREGLQERLHQLAVTQKRTLARYAWVDEFKDEELDDLVHAIASPEDVVIVVAGGEGVYSAVFNSWGGGEHGVRPVTGAIDFAQFCELPGVDRAKIGGR